MGGGRFREMGSRSGGILLTRPQRFRGQRYRGYGAIGVKCGKIRGKKRVPGNRG